MSYVRTSEHRALRAHLIHRWKPWLHSTGPRTVEGKRRAAMRGDKGGVRPLLRAVGREIDATEAGCRFRHLAAALAENKQCLGRALVLDEILD